jgi:hypothetical protein
MSMGANSELKVLTTHTLKGSPAPVAAAFRCVTEAAGRVIVDFPLAKQ